MWSYLNVPPKKVIHTAVRIESLKQTETLSLTRPEEPAICYEIQCVGVEQEGQEGV